MTWLKGTMNNFFKYRYLLQNLVQRDFKVKYRRSALGIAWSVLNPLLMSLVMAMVFGGMFKDMMPAFTKVVASTGERPSFLVYVLSGQLIFTFFSESTNMAMDSVYGNAPLIKKVYIPKYIFPLEKVLFSFVNLLFSLISLFIVILLTQGTWLSGFFYEVLSGSALSKWMLLFPLPLVLLLIFNMGIGLILSSAVVFFRDIKHLYGVLVLALTYLTPIFYDADAMFANSATLGTLIKLNPLYWYVGLFRQLVVYGMPPTQMQLLATGSFAVVALLVGLAVFRKTQDDFILYI